MTECLQILSGNSPIQGQISDSRHKRINLYMYCMVLISNYNLVKKECSWFKTHTSLADIHFFINIFTLSNILPILCSPRSVFIQCTSHMCVKLTCQGSGQLLYLLKVSFWETGSGNCSTVEAGGGTGGGRRSAQFTSLYDLHEEHRSGSKIERRVHLPLCGCGPVVGVCHFFFWPFRLWIVSSCIWVSINTVITTNICDVYQRLCVLNRVPNYLNSATRSNMLQPGICTMCHLLPLSFLSPDVFSEAPVTVPTSLVPTAVLGRGKRRGLLDADTPKQHTRLQ